MEMSMRGISKAIRTLAFLVGIIVLFQTVQAQDSKPVAKPSSQPSVQKEFAKLIERAAAKAGKLDEAVQLARCARNLTVISVPVLMK
jgi:hypothetical protein